MEGIENHFFSIFPFISVFCNILQHLVQNNRKHWNRFASKGDIVTSIHRGCFKHSLNKKVIFTKPFFLRKASQLTGFYIRATLAFNELRIYNQSIFGRFQHTFFVREKRLFLFSSNATILGRIENLQLLSCAITGIDDYKIVLRQATKLHISESIRFQERCFIEFRLWSFSSSYIAETNSRWLKEAFTFQSAWPGADSVWWVWVCTPICMVKETSYWSFTNAECEVMTLVCCALIFFFCSMPRGGLVSTRSWKLQMMLTL